MIVNGTASHFPYFLQCATEGTVMKISLKSISVGVALSTLSVAAMAADPIVGTWQTYEDNQPKAQVQISQTGPSGWKNQSPEQSPGQYAQRPLDDLHPWRRARLPGHRQRSLESLCLHDQEQ